MLNVAYLFPGQGAQYIGMGRDFYQSSPQAKKVLALADSALGFSLTELIFKGPEEELAKTINCQVAIFTVSIAVLRVLEARQPKISLSYTAGLSLGEYTALVAAGAIDFEQGLKLVHQRARYMEEAAGENPGGMLSLIGLSLPQVQDICATAGVEIANLNCPGQIVVSGRKAGLEKAGTLARTAGARGVIPLKVNGAFHSSLMGPAKQRLSQDLLAAPISSPRVPVISNVTAEEETTPSQIKENLARQICARTRWEDSVKYISAKGVRVFLEIGPGKVLKGLLGRIDPELQVYNIGTIEELERFSVSVEESCY